MKNLMRLVLFITCAMISSRTSFGQVPESGQALTINSTGPSAYNGRSLVMMGYAVWWDYNNPTRNGYASYDRYSANVHYNTSIIEKWVKLTNKTLSLGLQPPQSYYIHYLTLPTSLTEENQNPSQYGTLPAHKVTATPELAASGNYHSEDEALIRSHIALWTELGVDIIVPDLTNNVYDMFKENYTGTVETRAFETLCRVIAETNSKIKIVPAIGAHGAGDIQYTNGTTPLRRGVDFALDVLNRYPVCRVVYDGKPLVLIFAAPGGSGLNIASSSSRDNVVLMLQDKLITYKFMAGYIDQQDTLWKEGTSPNDRLRPPSVEAISNVWTWHDRLWSRNLDHTKEAGGSYTWVNGGSRAEFVAAPLTSPSVNGENIGLPYNRYSEADSAYTNTMCISIDSPYIPVSRGGVFYSRLSLARDVKPIFLFLPEFNHFHAWDCGYTKDTAVDIEPTVIRRDSDQNVIEGWGREIFDMVKQGISEYKLYESNNGSGRFSDVRFRGVGNLTVGLVVSGNAMTRLLAVGTGPSLQGFPNTSYLFTDPVLTMNQLPANSLVATNDSWQTDPTGVTAPATGNRVVPNSTSRIQFVNRNTPLDDSVFTRIPLDSKEAALTADINPGTYLFTMNDKAGDQNKVGHIFMETSDRVSNTRITAFSFISKVTSANPYGQMIVHFNVDRTMNVMIRASGVNLGNNQPILKSGSVEIMQWINHQWVRVDFHDKAFTSSQTDSGWLRPFSVGDYCILLRNAEAKVETDGNGMLEVYEQ